jgi:hypothetical protein
VTIPYRYAFSFGAALLSSYWYEHSFLHVKSEKNRRKQARQCVEKLFASPMTLRDSFFRVKLRHAPGSIAVSNAGISLALHRDHDGATIFSKEEDTNEKKKRISNSGAIIR